MRKPYKVMVEVPAGYEGAEEVQAHLRSLVALHGRENVSLRVIEPVPGDPRFEDPETEDLLGRATIRDMPG